MLQLGLGLTVLSHPTLPLVAFAGGLASFFSPCVLPLAPGYLAFITGSRAVAHAVGTDRRRMRSDLVRTALFFSSVAVVALSLGAVLSGVGWFLALHQDALTRAGGMLVLLMALVASGVVPRSQRQAFLRLQSVGWLAAPALGLVFALSWTPCITPVLTTIALLGSTSGSFSSAVVASIAYALGLSVPFFVMVIGVGSAGRHWAFARRHQYVLHWLVVAGLVLVGLAMLSGAWTDLVRRTVFLAV
ncbi:MAG: cytochrome c biosis protein CcdA [Marmoricola sp.]|nr:cytochrome c biosis protein CcdA [Marmoricola sp.]